MSATALYSSGLRAGFADLREAARRFSGGRECRARLAHARRRRAQQPARRSQRLDRINLIRPAEGIGIFQSAYGPRRTLYDTLTLRF